MDGVMGQQDYAWYAAFVPSPATNKPIVVVVTVEQGGFGDHAAAPVARQILSQWFLGRPGPWSLVHRAGCDVAAHHRSGDSQPPLFS
jgi:Penicillin binding protein transpeptidase domain